MKEQSPARTQEHRSGRGLAAQKGQPLFPVTLAHCAWADASWWQHEVNRVRAFDFDEHLLSAYNLPDWIMSRHVRSSLLRHAKNKSHFRDKWREELAL